MKLVLVSGFSGSGKSVALKALEDAGYFAVDNLPAALVESLLAEMKDVPKIAIAIDVRVGESVVALPALIKNLKSLNVDCRLLFIEANDDSIARRFAETRRPHPLADRIPGGVAACIAEERSLLADVAELGHRMDTSGVNANALRGWIKDWLQLDRSRLSLTFQSFGYKHGIPQDADIVFDVRFLPNPFYDPALRSLTGRDEPVKVFLHADTSVRHFVEDIVVFITRWLPSFARDNRAALTIAIGCTGGQHRSVYIAEELSLRFGSSQQVLVRHRDLS
ncbi:MAG: RNase adapter RapZ [Pseudomonadota bacterium]